MKKTRRPHTDLPQHIAEAIRLAWPNGVIDLCGERPARSFRTAPKRPLTRLWRVDEEAE